MSIQNHRLRSLALPAAAILSATSAGSAQSCLWTQRSGAPAANAAAYHAGLQRTLVMNTYYATPAQTWSWDGTSWTLIDSHGPTRREGAAVVYDSARDRLVLFGGYNGTSSLGDTWEWDRSEWRQVATSGPSPRSYAGMTFDSVRGRTVLFGGLLPGGTYHGDTWEWDGQAWMPVSTTGPAPRSGQLAFDPVRGRTVLYGGSQAALYTDLWEWDGHSWVQRPTNPPGTGLSWLLFDPSRSRMIACFAPGNVQTTTWELDPATALWTVRDPGHSPLGPAAFDTARFRVVAIGAAPSGGSATFEYDGAATDLGPYITQPPASGTYPAAAPLTLSVTAGGTGPLAYQWYRNGQPLVDGGRISGATTAALTINPANITDSGLFNVVVTNHCAAESSPTAGVQVAPVCYPNCDGSTTVPYLNINDVICFQAAFAAGLQYANCDGTCNPPPCLNINDFICFMQLFAAGCTAP